MIKNRVCPRELFVLKRSFRFGQTKRHDVMDAFEHLIKSESTATGILNRSVETYSQFLQRDGKKVIPKPSMAPPKAIDDNDLLKSIEAGARFAETGLRDKELTVNKVQWTNSLPVQNNALTFICQSIAVERIIDIHYVGLRCGEAGRARPVLPIGLENKSDQWRLIAHDLSAKEKPIKAFLLSRIISATKSDTRKPRSLGGISARQLEKAYNVLLNPKLTPEQCLVVDNQLRVNNGKVGVQNRYLHEYRIEYCGNPVSDNVVWPLIQTLDVE